MSSISRNYGSTDNREVRISILPKSSDDDTSSSSQTDSLRATLLTNFAKISFKNLSSEQRKDYIKAMCCRGIKTGVEVSEGMIRSALEMLLGTELSGLLKSQTQEIFNILFSVNVKCHENETYKYVGFPLTGPGMSIEKTIDSLLVVSVNTLLKAAAISWGVSHTITPPIKHYLSTKEEALMRRILENQGYNVQSSAISRSKLSTIPGKINHIIEYFMPLLFDGSRFALFIRFLQEMGKRIWLPINGSSPPIDFSNPPIYGEATFAIDGATFDIISGEEPVSNTILYTLLSLGLICYALQAVCNFHHDLQTKELEHEPPIALEDPTQ